MHLIRDAELAPFNAMGVQATAAALARVEHWYEIEQVLDDPEWTRQPLVILGGGSNVLFRRDFPGLVLRVENRGIQIIEESETDLLVRIAAGETWDDVVRWSTDRYLWGIENLADIPGCVGAAPIQNIGAYGCELATTLESVTAWDSSQRQWTTLRADQCGLGYRSSRFRSEDAGRFVITEVALRLRRHGLPVIDYPGVREALGTVDEAAITPAEMARAIVSIRHRKLPSPRRLGNVGSFFKNPVVDRDQHAALRADEPELVAFETEDGRFKLSAAWLIERCGWKGRREGDAGVYFAHALVLVNHGRATGDAIWQLARHIQSDVHERFGLTLDPEPTII